MIVNLDDNIKYINLMVKIRNNILLNFLKENKYQNKYKVKA